MGWEDFLTEVRLRLLVLSSVYVGWFVWRTMHGRGPSD